MSGPLLLCSIMGMALVVFWYVFDEATRGGNAKSGLLGMSDRADTARAKAKGSPWRNSPNKRSWRIGRQ
jgi:hypothetical protein